MKVFITIILAINCAIVLFLGYTYWEDRTNVSLMENNDSMVSGKSQNIITSFPSTKNWPVEAKRVFKKKIQEGVPFHITLLGSEEAGEKEFVSAIEEKLAEAYGEDVIQLSSLTYDGTSLEYVQNDGVVDLIETQPDLIIFEPFILSDNGIVAIDDSLLSISTVIEEVQEQNPDTVFILQPSFPLYGATYYPLQVDSLKEYAKEENIPFLDHWTAWPDSDSEELKEYLVTNLDAPNKEGYDLWSNYITDYLIHD